MVINFKSQKEKSEDKLLEAQVDTQGKKTIMNKINGYLLKFSRVPLREKLFFVQHLSIMLKASISLSVALNTLSEQTKNKYFITVLTDMANKVEKGISLAESMKPYSNIFGDLFIGMIDAGEMSGKLEDVLNELFIQMKKEHALISKVKGALTYPTVILVAMIGIGAFMIVFVIPKITSMFSDLNVELPLPTRILIGISDLIVNNGIIAAITVIILVFTIIKILRTEKGKYIFQSMLLRLPIISSIIKKINLARFARNISSLLKTDIMIIKSFQITANTLGNLHYRYAIKQMSEGLKKGGSITDAIEQFPKLFPPVVVQMVAIGEETGELDNILVELAEFYEDEVSLVMDNLPSIIEPLLILVLGAGVGAVAVAIIMPMYTITSAI